VSRPICILLALFLTGPPFSQPAACAPPQLAAPAAVGEGPAKLTVAQLQRIIVAGQGKSDRNLARELADVELGERVSATRFSQLQAAIPGPRAREALLAITDAAAFYDPPSADVVATAPPDSKTQGQIMDRVALYLEKANKQLPNFYATRVTGFYEKSQKTRGSSWLPSAFNQNGSATASVLYRDGVEVVKARHRPNYAQADLEIQGEFGPLLSIVLGDAGPDNVTWGYWEPGSERPLAVFRFHAPKQRSHYQVSLCCNVDWKGSHWAVYRQNSAFHGEIAVDPQSGAILRLVLDADTAPGAPVFKNANEVVYGPIDIGGVTYICPLRSIALMRVPSPKEGYETTLLNDVVYANYHLFRAEMRILTGNEADAGNNPTGGSPAVPR
jgi:hypothetical protein